VGMGVKKDQKSVTYNLNGPLALCRLKVF
jgi:hypothetical protein